jgi:hypothetical protein
MAFLACLNWSSATQPVFTSESETHLNDYVDQVRSCRHIPGFTLSVVKANDTWAQGYGVADMTTGRTVDNQTLFGIGSLTKAFTSTLLAILLTDNDKGFVHTLLSPGHNHVKYTNKGHVTISYGHNHVRGTDKGRVPITAEYPIMHLNQGIDWIRPRGFTTFNILILK